VVIACTWTPDRWPLIASRENERARKEGNEGNTGGGTEGTDIELEAINPTLPCRLLSIGGKREHGGIRGSTRTSTRWARVARTAIKKAVKRILKVETDAIRRANQFQD